MQHKNASDVNFIQSLNNEDKFDKYFESRELTKNTTCGYWIFRGRFLQKFASKKVYIILYGLVACSHTASFNYFSGTISTMEKRLKIPSKQTGMISVTNYVTNIFINVILSYYVAKQHKPRWMAIGILSVSLFCFLNFLPHLIYGPGDDALKLTAEYTDEFDKSNFGDQILQYERTKDLCLLNRTNENKCGVKDFYSSEENTISIIILYISQLISGIGGSLIASLGITYLDDNVKKSKAPVMFSTTFFIRMFGPAFGYSVASYSLSYYIAPTLQPLIDNKDPRWMGAWWLGWLFFGTLLLLSAFLISLFPKHLPRAVAREEFHRLQIIQEKSISNENSVMLQQEQINSRDDEKATWQDLKETLLRVIRNKILIANTFAATFYVLAYLPYTFYVPKYMEIQYRVSQSLANFITGTMALLCTALGLLTSGFIITKFKPRTRFLPAWNIIASVLLLIGITTFSFLGCYETENTTILTIKNNSSNSYCNILSCKCDFIKYSPVCGSNNKSYISPCHAGCTEKYAIEEISTQAYTNCSCIRPSPSNFDNTYDDIATPGSCPIDCSAYFKLFVVILCINKFLGGTKSSGNFLIAFRCVEPKDKAVSVAFTTVIRSLFAFAPGPIIFGYIYDSSCILWGETCQGKGNCWLYDAKTLRQRINILVAIFVVIAAILDGIVCYLVKDVKIFDDKKKNDMKKKNVT